MITLEYIIAQYQDDKTSVAIKSHRNRRQNPAIKIVRQSSLIIWELLGLQIGEEEPITGDKRVDRVDFYIGMENLIEQRPNFIKNLKLKGNSKKITNPVGTERTTGKKIRWNGAIGKVEINDIEIIIPPFKLKKNNSSELNFNVDSETSPYPVKADSGKQTTFQLHFGIEHNYSIRKDKRVKNAKIEILMTEEEYSTILDLVDLAINKYQNFSA